VVFYNLNKVVWQTSVSDGSSQKGRVKRSAQLMADAEKKLIEFKSDRTKRLPPKKCPHSWGDLCFLLIFQCFKWFKKQSDGFRVDLQFHFHS